MKEALHSILSQKLKFILSGLGITWGIFIMLVLLGMGNMADGSAKKSLDVFQNVVLWIVAGNTSMGYKGTPAGQRVFLQEADIELIKKSIPEVQHITPYDGRMMKIVTNRNRELNTEVKGITDDYFKVKHAKILQGRLFNFSDYTEARNVCMMTRQLADVLFGNDETPIGKQLQIGTAVFTIVSILKNPVLDFADARNIYIPFSTYQKLIDNSGNLVVLQADLQHQSTTDIKIIGEKLRAVIARKYNYNPTDYKIIQVYDTQDAKRLFDGIFVGLKVFIWFVGLCTLFSGVMGIANIMYIITKERTREIGIRKAIGASRWSIMRLFIFESILVTLFSGGLGIVAGLSALFIIGKATAGISDNIVAPYIEWTTLLVYILILIISGIVAGFIPANNASKIKPVEALRYE